MIYEFNSKQVVILGLARQGIALARFFVEQGAHVTISDIAPAGALQQELDTLGDLPVELELNGHPLELLDGCDILCLSGGVPPQIPIVQTAIERNIPLCNDSLLTLQLAPCPVIAITGSSGKTTTTTLVGKMLEKSLASRECTGNAMHTRRAYAGRPMTTAPVDNGTRHTTVHVGGNIGRPLVDRLHQISSDDLIVLELSSFQLELFDPELAYGRFTNLGPDVAAILNITPNHLDRHPSMAAYVEAKLNLLRHLKPASPVILNLDDSITRRLFLDQAEPSFRGASAERELDHVLAHSQSDLQDSGARIMPFSHTRRLPRGAWLEADHLIYNGQPFCSRSQVRLRGDHNISNLLAAAAISGAAGATLEAMAEVARSFAGVPHRLEEVANHNGVLWINDSIATAPERTVAGLRSFEPDQQNLILLAGGKDKNLPWDEFADEVLERVTYIIGFGEAGPMIVENVQARASYRRQSPPTSAVVNRLEDAVQLAAQIATANTVVLLSPGGTSYDAYKNFEQRGEHFRQLVDSLLSAGWSGHAGAPRAGTLAPQSAVWFSGA